MAELGQFALLLSLFLSSYSVIVDPLGVWRKDGVLVRSSRNATVCSLICLTVAIIALTALLVRSDFSISYVSQHTSLALPLPYKLSALWAGAAGSLLLWLWMQVGFVVWVFCRGESKCRDFAAHARVFANLVSVFFLIVLIYDKNPFDRNLTPMSDGAGLNPLLQHPAMVLHPPTLFIGYAGFVIPFAWSFALLKFREPEGSVPLFEQARNWIVISWLFLTIGIVLGAWWAYEELGWGGYWAWDPVENSSLMPWLTATALVHCGRTFRARSSVSIWLKVLSLLTFSLCIFGTFLTRYGLVSSVHAFPEPGLGILFMVLLAHIWIIAAVLFFVKHRKTKGEELATVAKGIRFVFWNNYLMLILMVMILVGTLFPFLTKLLADNKITLKPEYFTKITAPGGVFLLLLLSICPHLLKHGLKPNWRWIGALLTGVAAVVVVVVQIMRSDTKAYNNQMLELAFFVVCGFTAISFAADIFGAMKGSMKRSLRWYGSRLVHVGVVMMFVGMAGAGGYDSRDEQFALKPGEKAEVAGFSLVYNSISADHGPNYTAVTADVSVFKNDQEIARMSPSQAIYSRDGKRTSEVDIRRTLRGDLYLALTQMDTSTKLINMRILYKPLINWIWIGSILMVIGAVMVLARFYKKKAKVLTLEQ